MNGREGFATAANKCCKVLKGKGPGCTPGSGVSPEVSPKMPKSLGYSTARPVGVNGQALPHHCAGKTAAPSLSCCLQGVPWVASSSFPNMGCQAPQPRFYSWSAERCSLSRGCRVSSNPAPGLHRNCTSSPRPGVFCEKFGQEQVKKALLLKYSTF